MKIPMSYYNGLKFLGLLFICLFQVSFCRAEESNLKALAQVGERIINWRDLEREFRGRLEYSNFSKLDIRAIDKKVLQATLDRLIERELLIKYGKDEGLIDEEKIKKMLSDFLTAMGGEASAQTRITNQGVKWEDWKSNFSDDLRLLVVSESISKKFLNPKKEDIEAFMKEGPVKVFDPLRVRISVIVIEPKNALWEGDGLSDLIKELRMNPEKFADKAKEVSDGGSAKNGGAQGIVIKGTYNKAIEDSIYKLKVGEVSDVIPFEGKKYIFKVDERKGDVPDEKGKVAMAAETLTVENSKRELRRLIDDLKARTRVEKFDF